MTFAVLLAIALTLEAQARQPEARSLDGKPLYAPELTPAQREPLEKNLAEAQATYDKDPKDAENIIWLGRRLAYLGRYRAAIDTFGKGIALHPDDPRLRRHTTATKRRRARSSRR